MVRRYRVINGQRELQLVESAGERIELEGQRDTLYQRLEQGYQRIERGLADGKDMTNWEDLWVSLLHEYEQVCDELQRNLAA